MRSHTPTQRLSSALFNFDTESLHRRKCLREAFNEQVGTQVKDHVADLESSLAINKGIISDILNSQNFRGLSKEIICRLNKENAILQERLKITIKERDYNQAKTLMMEQIIADYKAREKHSEWELISKSQEFLDKLNTKEHAIQRKERKLCKVIEFLKKHTAIDGEARKLLNEIHATDDRRKITNVVEENEALKEELEDTRAKVDELVRWLRSILKQLALHTSLPMKRLVELTKNADETADSSNEDARDVISTVIKYGKIILEEENGEFARSSPNLSESGNTKPNDDLFSLSSIRENMAKEFFEE